MKNRNIENKSKRSLFEQASVATTKATGTTTAFIIAFFTVFIWAVTGPLFHFSEGWQLVINTGTGLVTFLMVFLIQQAQDKDTIAVHLKLNELLASNEKADTRLVNVEGLSGEDLAILKKLYARMNANDGIEPISGEPQEIGKLLEQAGIVV